MTETLLITGAGGNIGRAVARAAAAGGHRLVLTDHPDAARTLEETAGICRELGVNVVDIVPFDVTDAAAVDTALGDIAARSGPPTRVFNNAGYQGQFRNTIDYDATDLNRVLAVNVAGVFHVLQAAARALRDAGRTGSIVNCASMAGVSGAPNMPAYSASKAAVLGLTKATAKDLAGFGIRVNAISPGFIDSGVMWKRQIREQATVPSPYYRDDPAEVEAQMIGQIPLGRPGTLDEVADAVLFLLSERSSYLTGTNLELAGGAA